MSCSDMLWEIHNLFQFYPPSLPHSFIWMYFNNCWSFEHILFFKQNSAIAYYYENVLRAPAISLRSRPTSVSSRPPSPSQMSSSLSSFNRNKWTKTSRPKRPTSSQCPRPRPLAVPELRLQRQLRCQRRRLTGILHLRLAKRLESRRLPLPLPLLARAGGEEPGGRVE